MLTDSIICMHTDFPSFFAFDVLSTDTKFILYFQPPNNTTLKST